MVGFSAVLDGAEFTAFREHVDAWVPVESPPLIMCVAPAARLVWPVASVEVADPGMLVHVEPSYGSSSPRPAPTGAGLFMCGSSIACRPVGLGDMGAESLWIAGGEYGGVMPAVSLPPRVARGHTDRPVLPRPQPVRS